MSAATLERLQTTFRVFIFDILGLLDEDAAGASGNNQALESVMQLVLDMRQTARANKDWGTSDKIRDALNDAGIVVKDGKEGVSWGLA